MAKKKKAWSGRFEGQIDAFVEEFTASIPYDILLYRHDIRGSIAHARMLGKQKIIPQKEATRIASALRAIREEIEAGKISFDLSQEDIHMAVEEVLTKRLGKIGGKLHTARSRNDQVALDLRLYLRDSIDDIVLLMDKAKEAIRARAEEYFGVVMPGYTHVQRAQPVLFSHHLLAYHEMLSRDQERFRDARRRMNVSPLGAGALGGTPYTRSTGNSWPGNSGWKGCARTASTPCPTGISRRTSSTPAR